MLLEVVVGRNVRQVPDRRIIRNDSEYPGGSVLLALVRLSLLGSLRLRLLQFLRNRLLASELANTELLELICLVLNRLFVYSIHDHLIAIWHDSSGGLDPWRRRQRLLSRNEDCSVT